MSVNVGENVEKYYKTFIKEYLNMILKTTRDKTTENIFINIYIEEKFSNSSNKSDFKNDLKTSLKKVYNDVKKEDELLCECYYKLLQFFSEFDCCDNDSFLMKKIIELETYRFEKLKFKEKNFNSRMYNFIKGKKSKIKEFFNKIESDDFKLKVKITNISKLYDVELTHNIEFNSLYSSEAIENAFTTGKVLDENLVITYYMYTKIIINNIINFDYNKEYLLPFDTELFSKNKKLDYTLKILDFDLIKEFSYFKISLTNFESHKDEVYDLIREGFKFSIVLDKEYEINDVNFTKLKVFKYVIIDKESNMKDILNKIDNLVLL